MPVLRCTSNGRSGWKWGPKGKCYTGDGAKRKAINQGLAATGGKLEESVMPALLSRFTLHEDVLSRGHNIDTEACIIRNVKVLGKESKNHTVPNKPEVGQRIYSDEALDQAAKLYEGCEVNIDHPERTNPSRERGFVEGFGVLRNCRREPDGVYADLHYVKSHPLCEMVIERATKFPDKIGLSHNAEGRVAHEDGKWVVHSLEMVRSVDLVGKPATTSGLFESVEPLEQEPESEDEMTKPKTTKTTLRKVLESAFPETAKAVIQEMEAEELADMNAEMDVPAEAPTEGGEPDMKSQAKQAFRAMVLAAFDDESLDTKQTISKIREVLAAQEKLLGGMGGSDSGGESTETTTEETDDDEQMQESVQAKVSDNPELKALLEKVDRLERENTQEKRKRRARELCDEVGVVADSELLESLSLLENDDQMRKLIERMQVSPAATARQRPRSQSPLQESRQTQRKVDTDDPSKVASFLRNGA